MNFDCESNIYIISSQLPLLEILHRGKNPLGPLLHVHPIIYVNMYRQELIRAILSICPGIEYLDVIISIKTLKSYCM